MSLVTGGVSVMNIMLSNINEQTREIGLRRAIGATQYRIIQYYLMYAILITTIGGFLGILLGFCLLLGIVIVSNIIFVFSIKALIASLLLSFLSGLFFGLYPAVRASKIEPMQALRDF